MHIQPVSIQNYAVHNNNHKNINFTSSTAITVQDSFVSSRSGQKEPQKIGFNDRISQLRGYNVDFMSTLKIATLSKEDYDAILREIKEDPKREAALKEGKSKLTFKRDNKDNFFENMDITKSEYSYTEDAGYYSSTRMRTRKGENRLDVRRKEELTKETQTAELIDTSAFNHKYSIKNRFKEINTMGNDAARAITRNVSVKNAGGRTILRYSYAKSALNNSDLSKSIINDREYVTKVNKDGKVTIVSGTKGSRMDFLSRLDTDSIRAKNGNPSIEDARVESRKVAFVKALKLLPPQILCQMDDDFDTFKNGRGGAKGRTLEINLYCPESAAESMMMGTIENLVTKKGLTEEQELKETFAKERTNYINWLNSPKENCLIMGEDHYLSELQDPETDLMETIKKVCKLLWTEEYDRGRGEDEEARLLLNFFPKTVSYIVSKFELNNV